MTVFFDVLHLYYLPQYLPVYKVLLDKGIDCQFVFYRQKDKTLQTICEQVISDENLNAHWVSDWSDALNYYQIKKPSWIVFGNAVDNIETIHQASQTVLMQHGIGPKQCYYDVSNNLTSVRFVEGQHRLKRLQSMFPNGNFVDTGYAKLDPAFNQSAKTLSLASLGLDENKKTILYAPTFYPSSIECFSESFPSDFSDYNIILKPHFFSLTKKRYQPQKKLLLQWAEHNNVYLADIKEYNLIPFMLVADLMISDASSAIFEFAALDKPVVWCDFYKLRWTYRGIFSYRFKQRMDKDISVFHELTDRASNYQTLKETVANVFADPDRKQAEREKFTQTLAGKTDGHCADRIVNYLLSH